VGIRPVDNAIGVTSVYDDSKSGLMKGDIIEKIDATPLTFQNAQMLFGKMVASKPGSTVTITVKRGDKEIDVASILSPRVTRHAFSVNPNASPEQTQLRTAWMKNM
jgi:C-terminal processing protease CtpA/Prc